MSTLIMLPLDNNKVLQQEAEVAADQEEKSSSSLFRRRGSTTCQASKKSKKELLSFHNIQGKQLVHSSDHSHNSIHGGKGNCSVQTLGTEGTDSSLNFNTHSTEFLNNKAATMAAAAAAATTDCDDDSNSSSHDGDAIYYFGYGTIVNPIVRLRRGCIVPRENIQTAILYDHRLEFIKGGTANVIPCRGWDVKGVLIKFTNAEEFHDLHGYDLNYDIRDVSVSPISKTNIDPKNKNDYTAPFQQEDIQEEGEQEHTSSRDTSSGGMSCPNLGYNDDDSDDEEEYSCPFAMSGVEDAARSASMLGGNKETEDPNAIRAVTFMFSPEDDGGLEGSSIHSRRASNASSASQRSSSDNSVSLNDADTQSVVGMPQERYLKLIADGLRAHEIDEGYINDEILVIPFVSKERDGLLNDKYRTFPLVNGIKDASKVPKIPYSKYETKCCSPRTSSVRSNKQQKEQDLYFIVGRKVMKLIQENDYDSETITTTRTIINPVTRWIKEACHGRYDISLLVHQTFVDPECMLPLVDTEEDISPQHQAWAEHKLFLYLERGGLTAVQVYELNTNENGGRRPSLVDIGKRHSMPSLSMGSRFSLSMSGMSIGSRGRSSNHSNDSEGSDDRLGKNQLRHSTDLPLRSRTGRRPVSEGMSNTKFGTSGASSSKTFGSRSSAGTTSSSNTNSSSSTKKKFGFNGFKRSSN